MSARDVTVVAFGGNAMMRRGERGDPEEQIENARAACAPLAELILAGRRFILVHGNGPQVGRELDRGYLARDLVPALPLDASVAATQGTMGYFLELALRRALEARGVAAKIATLATLVAVDPADPALLRPDKPVGPFYSREEAERIGRERGVTFAADADRGYRQVVASPRPRAVLDLGAIATLSDAGCVVIAGGGGGIPVVRGRDGQLRGVEAVIDKDHTAALIGRLLGARELIDLTSVDFVYRGFGGPAPVPLATLTLDEARRMVTSGELPAGSMGPKVAAACDFLEGGGERVLIGPMERLGEALAGRLGTRIRAA